MYTLKESLVARHLRISIHPGGEVVVTIPKNISKDIVDRFVREKREWIERKVEVMKKYKKVSKTTLSKKEIVVLKQKAHSFVENRLTYFNTHYKYSWNTVSIRKQKTRWGSCSQKGNLNFNYKIALLPENLADYIVVHEMCHLKEFNHSHRFWDLVSQAIPDYKERRRGLRKVGLTLQ